MSSSPRSHRITKQLLVGRRIAIGGAIVAAVAGGGAAAALATDSSSANVYQACLKAANGELYQVAVNPSSPPSCNPHDTLISWNQTGRKGDIGPQGLQGDPGPQGPKGDTGAPGPPGDTGPQGSKGDTGAAGADGKTVLNGAGAPAPDLGTDGDFYIDTAANAIYGPKTGTDWGNATSLAGPQGAKGDSGPQGATGDTGPQGDPGPKGDPGPQGDAGATGPQGPIGPSDGWSRDSYNTATAIPADGVERRYYSINNVPPGSYLISGFAVLQGSSATGYCFAEGNDASNPRIAVNYSLPVSSPDTTVVVQGATTITSSSTNTISVSCRGNSGTATFRGGSLNLVKVGTLH